MARLNQVSWLYLTAIFLGYTFAGWLLSDCNAHWLTWAGTQAIVIHLAWVGFDAVAIAIAWIIALIWAGAFAYTWPHSIPWVGIAPWAGALAGAWVLALVLVLLLAQAQKVFAAIGVRTQAFWLLFAIASVGLGLGRILDIHFI